MKLDRIKFARLVSYLTEQFGRRLTEVQIGSIDEFVEFDVPAQPASEKDVCELLRQVNNPDGFIPAIKAYRVLTGAGLKESKDAVERYWPDRNARLFSIYDLRSKLSSVTMNATSYAVIESFIQSL